MRSGKKAGSAGNARQAPGGCSPAPVWFPYRAFEGGLFSRTAPPARTRKPCFRRPGSHPGRGLGPQKETPSAGAEGAKKALPHLRQDRNGAHFRFRQKSRCLQAYLTYPLPGGITVTDSRGISPHSAPPADPAEGQRTMYFSPIIIAGPAQKGKGNFHTPAWPAKKPPGWVVFAIARRWGWRPRLRLVNQATPPRAPRNILGRSSR